MTINTTAIKTPAAAITAQTEASWRRAWADQKEAWDPTGVRWERLEANDLDATAQRLLDPANRVTAAEAVNR